ncbi:hypothetical protein SLA2020_364860 [Shorea laevis]
MPSLPHPAPCPGPWVIVPLIFHADARPALGGAVRPPNSANRPALFGPASSFPPPMSPPPTQIRRLARRAQNTDPNPALICPAAPRLRLWVSFVSPVSVRAFPGLHRPSLPFVLSPTQPPVPRTSPAPTPSVSAPISVPCPLFRLISWVVVLSLTSAPLSRFTPSSLVFPLRGLPSPFRVLALSPFTRFPF